MIDNTDCVNDQKDIAVIGTTFISIIIILVFIVVVTIIIVLIK